MGNSVAKRTELETLLNQQLINSYSIICLAEENKLNELMEASIHYVFDLLDWGRKNINLKDDNKINISGTVPTPDKTDIKIMELEKELEDKLYNSQK